MPRVAQDGPPAVVLVVQPDPLGPLDRFGDCFPEAGLAVRLVKPFAGEDLPQTLEDDGLLVLGGRMSANADAEYPWLGDIRRLLGQAVSRSCPTLGICLGAQLLAQAFGGTVTLGDSGLETGVVRIRWRAPARNDALFADLPDPFLAGVFHYDMVDRLPDGAVWLGESAMYPHHAFRISSSAWGVQFHPEISLASYREGTSALAASEPEIAEAVRRGTADFEKFEAEITAATDLLAKRFADLVLTAARQRQARTST